MEWETIAIYGICGFLGLGTIIVLLAFMELFLNSLAQNPFGDKILKGIIILVVGVIATTILFLGMLYIPGVIPTKIVKFLVLNIEALICSLFPLSIATCSILVILAVMTQPLMEAKVYEYLEKKSKSCPRYNREEAEDRSWDGPTWAMLLSAFIMFGTIILMCISMATLNMCVPGIFYDYQLYILF